MDREEFINFAKQSNQLTEDDKTLISGLKFILDYFNKVEDEIENSNDVENNLIVTGGPYPDYTNVEANYNKTNYLRFKREEESIPVTFVSHNKTQFAEKHENALIDTLFLDNGKLYSEKHSVELNESLLNKSFDYLAAKPL